VLCQSSMELATSNIPTGSVGVGSTCLEDTTVVLNTSELGDRPSSANHTETKETDQ